jgi:hypothetical protein
MTRYWLDLFTPETWEEIRKYGFKVTGFRSSRWPIVSKITPGDHLICYITKLSRFSGVLRAVSNPYKDEEKASQIWKKDSFPCLVDVEPVIVLDLLYSVPKNEIVPKLSIARKRSGIVRGSPTQIPFEGGEKIKKLLQESKDAKREYPITQGITKTRGRKSKRLMKQEYGAPIDFRGLRHAPLNEQGVVYLFALVAIELGFYS